MTDAPAASGTDVDSSPRRVTSEDVARLLNELSLREIHLVRWSGHVEPRADLTVEVVDLDAEPPRVRIAPTELSFWFEHRVSCRDADGDVVAEIEVGVVADFDVADGAQPIDVALASRFADDNGAFMAWPFIREAVHTMSVRLGLAPITLGILRRDLAGTRPRALDQG